MRRGFLIYNREDYDKNAWFAGEFINKANLYDLDIRLIITDQLTLEVKGNRLNAAENKLELDIPDFVINRSRDSVIGAHFEKMGCRVFNSSIVTEICNNKAKTHQLVNSIGISSVRTLLCNKRYFSADNIDLSFPVILKTVSGHGGSEVYILEDAHELKDKVSGLYGDEFVLQEICPNPGKDIRVFVLGREVVAAVKRYSDKSFKSNFSLGGESERYCLKEGEMELLKKITAVLNSDFVGIDFILDENNHFLFNEIEDVVGTRTLYKNYDIDIVKKYLEHIKNCL